MNLLTLFIIQTLVFALFSINLLSTEAWNGSFPALLAFGDSILDTGNNNLLPTLTKANCWPYGINFTMKKPTGRFGNGRVFSDIVAGDLGIKETVPAYRQKFIAPDDLITGVSFASGGAGVDPLTSRLKRVLTPTDQLEDFKGYKRKLTEAVGASEAEEIIKNALYLISEGNNDIGITYFGSPFATLRGLTRRRYPSKLADWNKKFIKDIYDLGGKNFAVMGAIPLGCLPLTRGGILPFCNLNANKVAKNYNKNLKKGIKTWGDESDFHGAKFVYVDMYNSIWDIIKNYKMYGFTNEKNGCCCMPLSIIPCSNPDQYVFYDFAHPSERTYKIIAKELVEDIKAGLE